MYRSHVLVCGGTGCTSSGSDRIVRALENNIKSVGLEQEVKVIRTGCFGLCALGPIMIIYPKEARQIFDIKAGDTLLVLGDEAQGIAIVKADVMKDLAVKILKGLGKLSNGIEDEK